MAYNSRILHTGESVSQFVAGQRWINDAELSLGLGTILSVEHRTVSLIFHATGDMRTYSRDTAPLTRIRFSVGDQITDIHKRQLIIRQVEEMNGLLIYGVETPDGKLELLEERDLDTGMQLNRPLDRLLSGQVDDNRWYELRTRAWQNLLRNYSSHLTGMTGARTSLIPHQVYIASEVATRYAPRVLLADEVGLGKTIEAGMILHHQLSTGRARRVLIIVPEALIHQWLVELLRRFNLFFSIFDEDRCEAISESTGFDNPFMAEQQVLCSLDLFTRNPQRFKQVLETEWDLLIVDEAHHLEWSEDDPSEEYLLVEQLSALTRGLLLLTATPEQFGKQSHFARLRLLDADRFNDFEQFVEEEKHYQQIANLIDNLNNETPLSDTTLTQLKSLESHIDDDLLVKNKLDEADKNEIIHHLLDCHGTGRVLFRNTRAAIKGFPQRQLIPHPLPLPDAYKELFTKTQHTPVELLHIERLYKNKKSWTKFDPRVNWLVELLRRHTGEKILLITHYAETANELSQALKQDFGIPSSVFHEQLSIVERDRRAADFADHENGIPLLLCSEIGSEGRNFQFCHHIVLFDLPFNPDLLEQRIGRLDRIGQTQTIVIHAPFFEASGQQRLFDWYHQALNAFNTTCPAGAQIFSEHRKTLETALDIRQMKDDAFKQFITQCAQQHFTLNQVMHEGRDRLLEYSSCRYDIAEKLISRIEYFEQTSDLKPFMSELFDCYGVNMEEHKPGSYIITPAEHMIGQYPGLDDDGMTVTFDREVALHHDDMHFFSWDHPMVLNGVDMLLSNELGNTAVCSTRSPHFKAGQLIIQAVFIIDLEVPHEYQSFIDPHQLQELPIEFSYHESGNDISEQFSINNCQSIDRSIGKQIIQLKETEIRQVLEKMETELNSQLPVYLKNHYASRFIMLENEIDRLLALRAVNPQVRDDEIQFFQQQLKAMEIAIQHPVTRMDSIRLVITT